MKAVNNFNTVSEQVKDTNLIGNLNNTITNLGDLSTALTMILNAVATAGVTNNFDSSEILRKYL